MEFIKENYFYLIGFILLASYIHRIFTADKKIKETEINDLKDLVRPMPLIIFGVEIFWIVAGIYNHEKYLFIGLALTYLVILLYGLKEGANIDKADLMTNFDSTLKKNCNRIVQEQETSKLIKFTYFIQIVLVITILINHYKIALFYLFYN